MPKSVASPANARSLGMLLKCMRDVMRKDILLRQGYGGQEEQQARP